MREVTWKLAWSPANGPSPFTVHVFPHRTLLYETASFDESLTSALAGLSVFNVLLGQEAPLSVTVESREPVPPQLDELGEYLDWASDAQFRLKFLNTHQGEVAGGEGSRAILFSGGKDSVWMLNHLRGLTPPTPLRPVYVGGPTIAGEHRREYAFARDTLARMGLSPTFHRVEHFDYTSIGLPFTTRPRWRPLILIVLARASSREIWTGINQDVRFEVEAEGDFLPFFGETPKTLKLLAEMLDCAIYLAPPDSAVFMDLERSSKDSSYSSCFSPDYVCSPEGDFRNSCWKCRTYHIYRKLARGDSLSDEERDFYTSTDWMGDYEREVRLYSSGNLDSLAPFRIDSRARIPWPAR